MTDRNTPDRAWRRFDSDEEWENRPGALDRRWGYGSRLAPGYAEREQSESQPGYEDDYNAPGYWGYQEAWMGRGPFTGVGPKGYRRPDERIFEDVCERLSQHAQIDASDIEVTVEGGEVTLTGTVEDRHMKRMVEANVEMISGVVDVHNELIARHRPTREELAREKLARSMADKWPGGPTWSGPAGYDP